MCGIFKNTLLWKDMPTFKTSQAMPERTHMNADVAVNESETL